MASAYARSSRKEDEDDLRKDHRKRSGHQFLAPQEIGPPKKIRDIGKNITEEIKRDEEATAFKTRPGGKVTPKDIELAAPPKAKTWWKDPKTGERYGVDIEEENRQDVGRPTAKRKRRTQ